MLYNTSGKKIKLNESITIFKTSNQIIDPGNIITFQSSNSNTTKLTLYGNGIKIGKNVSKVKVSGNITYHSGQTTRQWFNVMLNSVGINDLIEYGTSQYLTTSMSPEIIDVKENDLITIKLFNIEGSGRVDVSSGVDASSTYLTVEVVE